MNDKLDKDFDLASTFPIFKEVPDKLKQQIKDASITKLLSNKSMIFQKDEPLKYLYLIASGTVHVVKEDKEGKEQIVSILRKGDFFPHIGLFNQHTKTPGTAFVTEDSLLILVPIDLFKELAMEYPIILIEYSMVLSKKIKELQNRLEEKAFYNTYEQIVRRIIFLANQYGKKINEDSVQLTVSLTHEEIAHLVGTTRETVSRTITKLKKLNAIEITQGRWIIHLETLKGETDDC